jgi:DNA-binding CsgD family transcriptional regulator/PAS domain-containing protein
MGKSNDSSRTIERIYAAARDPTEWPAALLQTASLLGGGSALLMVVDPYAGTLRAIAAGGVDEAFVGRYRDQFAARDGWLHALAGQPVATIRSDDLLATEPSPITDRSVQAFLSDNDGGHALGAVLGGGPGGRTVIVVHRAHHLGPHAPADGAMCALLLPHLQAALALQRELTEARARAAWLEAVLDRLPLAVLLVDHDLKVWLCNRAARRLTAARLGLVVRDGRLRALEPAGTARLQQIVGRAADAAATAGPAREVATRLMHADSPIALQVMTLPLPTAAGGRVDADGPVAALLVGDSQQTFHASEAVIGALYQLTLAEARLVGALLTGMRVRELADSLGLSEQTIRTQLKRVLQKTGTGRQSELVRMVLTGPTLFTCESDDPDDADNPEVT